MGRDLGNVEPSRHCQWLILTVAGRSYIASSRCTLVHQDWRYTHTSARPTFSPLISVTLGLPAHRLASVRVNGDHPSPHCIPRCRALFARVFLNGPVQPISSPGCLCKISMAKTRGWSSYGHCNFVFHLLRLPSLLMLDGLFLTYQTYRPNFFSPHHLHSHYPLSCSPCLHLVKQIPSLSLLPQFLAGDLSRVVPACRPCLSLFACFIA